MSPSDETCPRCGAQPGDPCDMVKFPMDPPADYHSERGALAMKDDAAE